MKRIAVGMFMVFAAALSAQTTAQRTPEQLKASFDAHRADFDYLLGDWEFTGTNKQFGKFHGYWSATRLPEGSQIFDEYRVVGDSGETYYVTTTLRAYNAVTDQWELVSLERGNGLQNVGTGHRDGSEVRIEQRFGYGTSNPSILRIHYSNIGPDHFSWTADRSADGGKTWTADFQQLDVHRIGPAHVMAPMTMPKKAP